MLFMSTKATVSFPASFKAELATLLGTWGQTGFSVWAADRLAHKDGAAAAPPSSSPCIRCPAVGQEQNLVLDQEEKSGIKPTVALCVPWPGVKSFVRVPVRRLGKFRNGVAVDTDAFNSSRHLDAAYKTKKARDAERQDL